MTRRIADAKAVQALVNRLAVKINSHNRGVKDLALVGIKRRGVPLAQRIAARLNRTRKAKVPVGAIDITLYRDDLQMVAETPIVRGTEDRLRHQRQDAGAGGRRGLHRPHHPRRAVRTARLRPAAGDPARRPRRPGPPGTAHPARLHRPGREDQPERPGRHLLQGNRRPRRSVHDPKDEAEVKAPSRHRGS